MAQLRRNNLTSAATSAILIFGTLALAGCIQEVPLVSEAKITTSMSLDEQRIWVGKQLDTAVAASEVADGWYDLYWHDVFWSTERPQDRELLLSSLFPEGCGGNGGRVGVWLKNMTAKDPLAVAAEVREFWESEGWIVTDVWNTPSSENPHFRADGADGELLGFEASAAGMTLSVHSSCSHHETVVNWQDDIEDELLAAQESQTDSGSINEFKDELERREEAG